jgi:hypothetical protein
LANNPGGSDDDSEDDEYGYKKSQAETAGLYHKLMFGKFIVGLTTLHNYLGKLQYTSLIKNFRPKKLIGRTFNTS